MAISAGDYVRAVVLLQSCAGKGDPCAFWELGTAYHVGGELSLKKDVVVGACLYHRSAEAGYAPGMADYAACLWFGVGVMQNRAAAAVWGEQALYGDT